MAYEEREDQQVRIRQAVQEQEIPYVERRTSLSMVLGRWLRAKGYLVRNAALLGSIPHYLEKSDYPFQGSWAILWKMKLEKEEMDWYERFLFWVGLRRNQRLLVGCIDLCFRDPPVGPKKTWVFYTYGEDFTDLFLADLAEKLGKEFDVKIKLKCLRDKPIVMGRLSSPSEL